MGLRHPPGAVHRPGRRQFTDSLRTRGHRHLRLSHLRRLGGRHSVRNAQVHGVLGLDRRRLVVRGSPCRLGDVDIQRLEFRSTDFRNIELRYAGLHIEFRNVHLAGAVNAPGAAAHAWRVHRRRIRAGPLGDEVGRVEGDIERVHDGIRQLAHGYIGQNSERIGELKDLVNDLKNPADPRRHGAGLAELPHLRGRPGERDGEARHVKDRGRDGAQWIRRPFVIVNQALESFFDRIADRAPPRTLEVAVLVPGEAEESADPLPRAGEGLPRGGHDSIRPPDLDAREIGQTVDRSQDEVIPDRPLDRNGGALGAMIIPLHGAAPFARRSRWDLRISVAERIILARGVSVVSHKAVQRPDVVRTGALRIPQADLQCASTADETILRIDLVLVVGPLRIVLDRRQEGLGVGLEGLGVLLDPLHRRGEGLEVLSDPLYIVRERVEARVDRIHRRVQRLLLRRLVAGGHARPRRLHGRGRRPHVTGLRLQVGRARFNSIRVDVETRDLVDVEWRVGHFCLSSSKLHRVVQGRPTWRPAGTPGPIPRRARCKH